MLFGASAGMICWFEAGVTDSFGPQLEGMRDGLGFLAGSACPHYDGEALRRPRYRELVDGGFPEGLAADDGVGLHYVGTELREVVTCRPGAAAYRVTRDGEQLLEATRRYRLVTPRHKVMAHTGRMENTASPRTCSLGLLFGSPWLVASMYFWRKRRRDGAVTPSLGEQVRNRWLS